MQENKETLFNLHMSSNFKKIHTFVSISMRLSFTFSAAASTPVTPSSIVSLKTNPAIPAPLK